ncbi:anthranilate phosphoribosyltransferase [Marinicella gelatinilytica]|uniref:anthranilate phosphoribosyltransferase n=1 Tax=Marinicella gelatinilytica TaxID=2996017 RepID=UPI00226083F9|nr:anthranilate phosphoribosyltransferase [Marinicella gelatinilytica]MCX7545521.1 anthranilate phosphoribosyltransferase [Marinicella gelatinilytica]
MSKNAIQQSLDLLGDGQVLPDGMVSAVMNEIMDGDATSAQIGGWLMAMKIRGETAPQITEAVNVMRQRATRVNCDCTDIIDTCGTGGDGKGVFNVSTGTAFIAAAAGCPVAKHGNRSVSSTTGSADVLEAAGMYLDLSPQQVATCIDTLNIGFLFAPAHHGATKHAVLPRKELGVRTLFNLLGPLTNPAGTKRQVIGIFSKDWMRIAAEVMHNVGSEHVMFVHSHDGMDEISLSAPTYICELKNGVVSEYSVKPEDFGVSQQSMDNLVVNSAQESLQLISAALQGKAGPAADILALNSGAAIYVAGQAASVADGVKQAQTILQSGKAWMVWQQLVELTQQMETDND